MNKILLEKNKILLPRGFKADSFSAGLKKNNAPDMAVIFSTVDSAVAGTFTTNKVRASCVSRNEKLIKQSDPMRCIIVNSGNANACTGIEGSKDNIRIAECVAKQLGIETDQVFTASTGVIGVELPMPEIEKAIKSFTLPDAPSIEGFERASRAILTTDLSEKKVTAKFTVQGKEVTITGMAKGSGMIHPNMATMLAFITTDLAISQSLLMSVLQETVEDTFNMISVDGDTSTNDMVLMMANGMAKNNPVQSSSDDFRQFKKALKQVCVYLAQSIAADGEGATKLLEAEVNGAKSVGDAKKIAKAVISSNLVKTAFFGMDPNWGRIIAAIGYSGANFNPDTVSIYFQGAPGYSCLMDHGTPHDYDRETVMGILKEKKIIITINLNDGNSSAVAWGCDLSYDYVKINAEYTT